MKKEEAANGVFFLRQGSGLLPQCTRGAIQTCRCIVTVTVMAGDPEDLCREMQQWRGAVDVEEEHWMEVSAEDLVLPWERAIGWRWASSLRTQNCCWFHLAAASWAQSHRNCSGGSKPSVSGDGEGLLKLSTTLPKNYCWLAGLDHASMTCNSVSRGCLLVKPERILEVDCLFFLFPLSFSFIVFI